MGVDSLDGWECRWLSSYTQTTRTNQAVEAKGHRLTISVGPLLSPRAGKHPISCRNIVINTALYEQAIGQNEAHISAHWFA